MKRKLLGHYWNVAQLSFLVQQIWNYITQQQKITHRYSLWPILTLTGKNESPPVTIYDSIKDTNFSQSSVSSFIQGLLQPASSYHLLTMKTERHSEITSNILTWYILESRPKRESAHSFLYIWTPEFQPAHSNGDPLTLLIFLGSRTEIIHTH